VSSIVENVDHFTRLGLPRRFDLKLPEIEANYFRLSREVHPDFHSGTSAESQAQVLDASSKLNQAFRVLRNPFTRAEYLLELLAGNQPIENKNIPQSLLMEMMEFREQIEEANQNRDEEARTSLSDQLSIRYNLILAGIGKLFEKDNPDLQALRLELNSAKYLQSMMRDLD
jgi:molecular chaperone HscB